MAHHQLEIPKHKDHCGTFRDSLPGIVKKKGSKSEYCYIMKFVDLEETLSDFSSLQHFLTGLLNI